MRVIGLGALLASVALGVALSGCTVIPPATTTAAAPARAQLALSTRAVPLVQADGLNFRDLDRNGALTPYEDWRLTPQQRAADLLGRMTLAEKAGQMVVGSLPNNAARGQAATAYDRAGVETLISQRQVTQLISRLTLPAQELLAANNGLQELAEQGRLGIPALINTDPRHGFTELAGASVSGGQFSKWPNGAGLAALRDPALTQAYAALVRDDLRATGFAMLLGPQIDLASEPRWPRSFDTFGEDAEVSAAQAEAFVIGLQGGATGVAPGGVAAVVKHFAGYGASANGFDAHNYYGRHSRVSAAEWPAHVRPFVGAFRAQPSSVMPAYSILLGLTINGQSVDDTVAVGYNRAVLTDELRTRLGFTGVTLSDWAITNDCNQICRDGVPAGQAPDWSSLSTAWGVEHLSRPQRFALSLSAGMDQFGGVDDPAPLIAAVEQGLVTTAQIDAAVNRILIRSFELGLFDAPFVDAAMADSVGTAEELALGLRAQAESSVLLEADRALALPAGTRVLLFGVAEEAASAAGLVPVSDPAQAQAAILRTRSPSEMLHPGYPFGAMHQEGSLAFPADHPARQFIDHLPAGLPLFAAVQLDRAAILNPIKARANVLLATFGTGDAALLQVLTGRVTPRGYLPFELPSSMAAVEAQSPGAAADSADPLYPLGYRLER